ncbi:cation acetate symporter [Streptomyces sp. NPDC050625]|uniref:solute symporter family protein n=1 Tax=Streptomyces sp. NPDC050625 TaxID=3154629 RepID=UPI003433918B
MSSNSAALWMFAGIIAVTLGITWWAGRRTSTASEFWAAGHAVTPTQNAMAITGDFLSASAFLGTTGLIFFYGFDGMLYLLVPLAAWIPIILLFAERLRNLGQFTLTDVLVNRFRKPVLRRLLAGSTLVITGVYLLAQLVAAGSLFQLLAGVPFSIAVVITAVVMLIYVTVGGMLATTWVQMIKAALLVTVLTVLTLLTIVGMRGGVGTWLSSALETTGGKNPLIPGNLLSNPWNSVSVGLALLFGVAGLPHVMMRLFTVRDSGAARRSASRAIAIIAIAEVLIVVCGLAARNLLGDQETALARSGGNLVAPKLGEALAGGPGTLSGALVLALVAAVAFATIVAVVAGLLINAASAVVRDLWRPASADGDAAGAADANGTNEIRRARTVTILISVVMAGLTILVGPGMNAALLVTLAFGIAASANFPTLLLTLFWRRFTVQGAISGMCTGLISSAVLLFLGPTLWPGHGSSPLPLTDPTIISMPLGFLACVAGSLLSNRDPADEFEALQLKALLGTEQTDRHSQELVTDPT